MSVATEQVCQWQDSQGTRRYDHSLSDRVRVNPNPILLSNAILYKYFFILPCLFNNNKFNTKNYQWYSMLSFCFVHQYLVNMTRSVNVEPWSEKDWHLIHITRSRAGDYL